MTIVIDFNAIQNFVVQNAITCYFIGLVILAVIIKTANKLLEPDLSADTMITISIIWILYPIALSVVIVRIAIFFVIWAATELIKRILF